MPDNEKNIIESKLPYGRELTDFLVQNYITEANVNQLLQRKGVFYGLRDKKFTVPLASSMLLTPEEFEYIKEKRNTREDSLKRRSSVLQWKSDKTLAEEIPDDINVNDLVDTQFKGYEIVGSPRFVVSPDNQNKVAMDFEIDRVDNTKSWCNTRRRFQGSVELEVKDDVFEVSFVKHNTSPETEEVCNRVLSHIKKNLVNKGCVADKQLDVLFSSFNNEQRVQFFWDLTGEIVSSFMKFEGISNVDLKPDDNQTIPSGLKIQWMANNINKLHVSGERVHDTFFITDKNCHPFLIIWCMEAKYSFDDHIAKGTCKLTFDFPGASQNSELSITVTGLRLDSAFSHVNKKKVKKHLLEQIDQLKISVFKEFIEKTTAS